MRQLYIGFRAVVRLRLPANLGTVCKHPNYRSVQPGAELAKRGVLPLVLRGEK
jgi:hypothetical protein